LQIVATLLNGIFVISQNRRHQKGGSPSFLRRSTIGTVPITASSFKKFVRSAVNERGFIDLFGGKARRE
tara:strand:+ start:803 stop:1009 length:207 start_codon:yes stop_codon:yes gene_type:complete